MANKKSFLLMLLFITVAIAFSSMTPPQDLFKNLQVLPKDISEEELNGIMDGFEQSMNVKCNFCHSKSASSNQWEYEKDNKSEKDIARKMMRMTVELNNTYFNYNKAKVTPRVVTCYTCHQGKTIPDWQPGKKNKSKDW